MAATSPLTPTSPPTSPFTLCASPTPEYLVIDPHVGVTCAPDTVPASTKFAIVGKNGEILPYEFPPLDADEANPRKRRASTHEDERESKRAAEVTEARQAFFRVLLGQEWPIIQMNASGWKTFPNYSWNEYVGAAGPTLCSAVELLLAHDRLRIHSDDSNAFFVPWDDYKDEVFDLHDGKTKVSFKEDSFWFDFEYTFNGEVVHKVKEAKLYLGVSGDKRPVVTIDATHDDRW